MCIMLLTYFKEGRIIRNSNKLITRYGEGLTRFSKSVLLIYIYIYIYTHPVTYPWYDMWNRHNVHKMFINIYRNPNTRNQFRYKTLLTFLSLKVFSTWGERDTIFLCWLLLHRQLSTQPMGGARTAQIGLASTNSESRPLRSEAGS